MLEKPSVTNYADTVMSKCKYGKIYHFLLSVKEEDYNTGMYAEPYIVAHKVSTCITRTGI